LPHAGMISQRPAMASQIQLWAIDQIIPYERNARSHSDSQIAQIAASIGEFGFTNPILVNAKGQIIAGYARYLAARKRNLEQVPVIQLEHLTATQERAYRVADNQLALNASWNEEVLREELQALIDEAFQVNLIGLTEAELERLSASPELQVFQTDEDAAPKVAQVAVSRKGDVWTLDHHQVLCGDATESGTMNRLLAGSEAAMTVTDPPYNVAYRATSRKGTSRPIQNDDLGPDFERFLFEACRNILALTAGAVYLFMSSSELHTLYRAFTRAGGHYSTFLIWAKPHFTLGRSDYQRQYEPILYGWREGVNRFWCGARNQGDVWSFAKPAVNDLHPTMKPVALIEQAIQNSSHPGNVVLDPFGGSGSTLIACQKTGRDARLVEIDPLYVDVIVRRWQEFTGREAVLEGDGRSFAAVAREREQDVQLENQQ
jgi:DNA modification methylase